MKHLIRMIVGAVVAVGIIAAIAMFFVGDFLAALFSACAILFCSVVLTGGLALVVIVPVVYFLGYVACNIYESYQIPPAATLAPFADRKVVKIVFRDRRIKAICQFLGKLDDPLSNREAIERELQRAGWDRKIIAEAFAEFSKSRS